jgi:hypothetical protein
MRRLLLLTIFALGCQTLPSGQGPVGSDPAAADSTGSALTKKATATEVKRTPCPPHHGSRHAVPSAKLGVKKPLAPGEPAQIVSEFDCENAYQH